MQWGSYLTNGVVKGSYCNDEEKRENVFVSFEKYFLKEGLSQFNARIATGFIKNNVNKNPDEVRRVMQFLYHRINKIPISPSNVLQVGCPTIVPQLRSIPIWDTSLFDWVATLEAQYPAILAEFQALRGVGNHFQPYRAPASQYSKRRDEHGELATDSGHWNVCYLLLHGMDFQHNVDACPIAVRAVKSVPRQYDHCFFSALAPNTNVTPHHGPTNKKLRIQLPLVVPTDEHGTSMSHLIVAGISIPLQEGKCIIFDDSFEHSARNDHPSKPRVILIFDIWHPDLTNAEVKIFSYLENAKFKSIRKMATTLDKKDGLSTEVAEANFLSVISAASGKFVEESLIW